MTARWEIPVCPECGETPNPYTSAWRPMPGGAWVHLHGESPRRFVRAIDTPVIAQPVSTSAGGEGDEEGCERCNGTGHDWEPGPTGEPISLGPCPDCDASGKKPYDPLAGCSTCHHTAHWHRPTCRFCGCEAFTQGDRS